MTRAEKTKIAIASFLFGSFLSLTTPAFADSVGLIQTVVRSMLGTSSGTTGQVLTKQADGSMRFATVAGGGETLAQTLALGNTTGAHDISVNNGQKITSDASLTLSAAGPAGAITLDPPGTLYLHTNGAATNADIIAFISGVFGPGFDGQVDIGSSSTRFKNAYFSGATKTGAFYPNVKTITVSDTPYAVVAADYAIYVNASGGAVTVTLPAVSSNVNRQIVVKAINVSGGNVTVARAGSDTIDGATSITISTRYQSYTLHAPDSGADWGVE